jgi:FkbM family methyltransferase
MKPVWIKLSRLMEILLLPGGLAAKLRTSAFHQGDWQMCRTLGAMGVRPRAVVDVGANIGQFALAAAHMLRPERLISLEPIPEVRGRLQKLPLPSGIDFEICGVALADRPGEAEFRVMSQTASSSLLPLGRIHQDLYPEIREERTIRVPVETLDIFLAKHPLLAPSLLKLDVQGAELAVLRGCARLTESFRWILLETSTLPFYTGGAGFAEIHTHLSQAGYRWLGPVTVHQPQEIKPADSLQFDALYVSEA